MDFHLRKWGEGPPVLALHGLGLESSSFTGLAEGVNDLGMSMLAADLPGFGMTPLPEEDLTPAVLAQPVLQYAQGMDEKPLVMGMSLGARVALEAALVAPDLFRGVVMMAPPFPQRSMRWSLGFARLLLNPGLAERLPVEIAWPLLKAGADRMESGLEGHAAQDWFLRSSKRTVYYISCPATRRAFVSAARELATEPAFGPGGLWTRVESLGIPAAFVWGGKDRIVGTRNGALVAAAVPEAFQVQVPCAGHFDNGPHFACMQQGALQGIELLEAVLAGRDPLRESVRSDVVGCLVDGEDDLDGKGLEEPAAAGGS